MARRVRTLGILTPCELIVHRALCEACGRPLRGSHRTHRTIRRLDATWRVTLVLRRCLYRPCGRYRQMCRPEEESAWALPHGEFGFDVIALIGQLRYGQHRSIPEIHQHLCARGVIIAERTVTNLLARYEELVALRLTSKDHLKERLLPQGHVILGLDGLKPDVGHEVLWVLRDCVSGDVLLARSLLSECGEEVADLIREVQAILPVPITGVISDGQLSIRRAVEKALPNVPHQLCQYHYVREAAKPIYEADRHAKKELKQQVRGVRPIERALEGVLRQKAATTGVTPARKLGVMELLTPNEVLILQAYCHAIRSALTDDGQPPLCASGVRLQERLTAIVDSLQRSQLQADLSWSMAFTLERLRDVLQHGLDATAPRWPPIRHGYTWVYRAMHILANDEHHTASEVHEAYRQHVVAMEHEASLLDDDSESRAWCLTFLKVSASYGAALFSCYDLPDLPPTNNDLEQLFGSVRYHERRVSGRKQVAPSLLLRGAVRIFATVGALPTPRELCPANATLWREIRHAVEQRQRTRRAQRRFRQNPAVYLQHLETAVTRLGKEAPKTVAILS